MGKKGGKRKTRWRVLPICEDGEEATRSRPGHQSHQHGGHQSPYRPARPSTPQQTQPPPASRTVSFNDDEYTKITTPRQDVLFKKGYLGRARPTPEVAEDAAAKAQVGEEAVPHERCPVMNVPEDPYLYTNGYVDHGNVYYMNGDGYELCNFTVLVGPAPAPAPVLAAIPCQPLPLQPLEWFNPPTAFVHCLPHMHSSSESQNSGPQSSESPGSPEECEEIVACEEEPPFYPPHPPAYVYPGYMFGPPVFSMNGITIQGGVPQPLPTEVITVRHHKKKRRKRRQQGTVDDGSEGSSSYEKEAEKPLCQTESETSKDCELSCTVNNVECVDSPIREVEVEENNETIISNEIAQESISDSPTQTSCKDEHVNEEITRISEDQVSQNEPSEIYRQQILKSTSHSCTEVETGTKTESQHNTSKKSDALMLKSEGKGSRRQSSESKAKKTKQSEKKITSESTDGLNVHENTGNKRSKKGSRGGVQNMTEPVKKISASVTEKGDVAGSSITEINSSGRKISERNRNKKSSKSSKEKNQEENETRITRSENCDQQSSVHTEVSTFTSVGDDIVLEPSSNAHVHLIETGRDSDMNCISRVLNSAESLVKHNSQVCSKQDTFNVTSSGGSSGEPVKMQKVKNNFTAQASEPIAVELQRLHSVVNNSELHQEDINTDINASSSTGESSLEFATSNVSPVSESPKEVHTPVNEIISPVTGEVLQTLHILKDDGDHVEDSNKHSEESKSLSASEMEISSTNIDVMLKEGELQHKHSSTTNESTQDLHISNAPHNVNVKGNEAHMYFSISSYAEKTANNIVEAALHEIQVIHLKKLKITEAVEKWLYSQKGKEIICLDSDALKQVREGSEERETLDTDEKLTNPVVPGPKNVLCNPLLASSLKFLFMDDASIRVAIKFCEECVSLTNLIPHMKLLNINSNMKYDDNTEKNICSVINFHGLNTDCGFAFVLQNKKHCRILNSLPKSHTCPSTLCELTDCMEKFEGMEDYKSKHIANDVENTENSLSGCINFCEIPDTETECYIWDADILKKQANSQLDTEFKLESDNVSCMCDPSLFVGKYYSLGLPEERTTYDSQTDTESEDELALQSYSPRSWLSEASNSIINTTEDDIRGEEAIDVIEAMDKNIDIFELNYMNFSELNSGISSVACTRQKDINFVTSTDINMQKTRNGLHHESAILMRHLKEKGPFPVGGICCLIQ